MKLNLLPKTVAKGVAAKFAFTAMLILVIANLAVAFVLNQAYRSRLQSLQDWAASVQPSADRVVQASKEADEIIAGARIVLTNTELVKAINEANQKYPDLYDELRQYIPAFFRVRTITAASTGANVSTVTIVGYLQTFQQYADVVISLLRHPDVIAVGRSGFNPVPPGDEGPFGYNPDAPERGPIPGYSVVTLTLQLQRDLQAPDPLPTLRTAAGAPAGQAGQPSGGGTATRPTPGAVSTGGVGGAPGGDSTNLGALKKSR
ncbi:MAG TPA: hypothetical protein VNK96_04405 [Fimbriimonadales bacterium]|nr:hypothetical protein [Fimbriimonadales bacterium]